MTPETVAINTALRRIRDLKSNNEMLISCSTGMHKPRPAIVCDRSGKPSCCLIIDSNGAVFIVKMIQHDALPIKM